MSHTCERKKERTTLTVDKATNHFLDLLADHFDLNKVLVMRMLAKDKVESLKLAKPKELQEVVISK